MYIMYLMFVCKIYGMYVMQVMYIMCNVLPVSTVKYMLIILIVKIYYIFTGASSGTRTQKYTGTFVHQHRRNTKVYRYPYITLAGYRVHLCIP